MYGVPTQGLSLQSVLASGSASGVNMVLPHHPITCTSELRLEEDGSLHCPHAKTEPNDRRTMSCLQSSVAILLIELAFAR